MKDLSLAQPKTKLLAQSLKGFSGGMELLVVAGKAQSQVLQAAGNLATVKVLSADQLNVYDVVRAHVVVISDGELSLINEVWS